MLKDPGCWASGCCKWFLALSVRGGPVTFEGAASLLIVPLMGMPLQGLPMLETAALSPMYAMAVLFPSRLHGAQPPPRQLLPSQPRRQTFRCLFCHQDYHPTFQSLSMVAEARPLLQHRDLVGSFVCQHLSARGP